MNTRPSQNNDVVHFSLPPQVEIETDPLTYDYAYMKFDDTTTCNARSLILSVMKIIAMTAAASQQTPAAG